MFCINLWFSLGQLLYLLLDRLQIASACVMLDFSKDEVVELRSCPACF